MNEQIRGVAKRYAKEGYVTIAPNLFTRNGDVMNEKNVESTMRYMWTVPPDKRSDPDTIQKLVIYDTKYGLSSDKGFRLRQC